MSAQPALAATSGTAARPLGAPGRPQQTVRRRTPLSLVTTRPAKSRVPFAVFSMVALVAALIAVLLLNISVSSTQYELVVLRGQEVSLTERNQALTQQLEDLEAPQNLASSARDLDMVASQTFGLIDVNSGKVSGQPEAAKESEVPRALVAAPEVTTLQEVPEAGFPVVDVPGPSAEASPAEETPPAAETQTDPRTSSASGGTIPAPQQASPGQ
ncbi:hypothetical protein [Arthrobacter sp. H5]|uniref:hypothetical protein n=1 Tax=Arthrobacter sp. H5 TaxID=1267973 RepID=UPI000486E488|nr:hypothetical protein [Arthrobacter sp. H5]